MRTINRLQDFFLQVPLWHPFVVAIVVGAPIGFLAATTSINIVAVWFAGWVVAMTLLTVDVLLHLRAGKARPGVHFR